MTNFLGRLKFLYNQAVYLRGVQKQYGVVRTGSHYTHVARVFEFLVYLGAKVRT